MAFDFVLSGGIILSAHNGYEPFIGSVAVEGERIALVKPGTIAHAEAKHWIDAAGKIILPGLVNAHCHGDMTLARGLGDDLTLLEQIQRFSDTNWFYSLISDDDRFYSRQLTYAEALLSGTTFLCENMYWSLGARSVAAMAQTGIQGALCEDVRADFSKPGTFVGDDWLKAFADLCRIEGLVPVLGSISEEDFDSALVRQIAEKAKTLGVPETRHLAENDWRVEMVKEKFGTTPIRFLHAEGALHPGMIGSHAVYADEAEAELLAQNGVSVANTPLCECKIADGIAPIPMYLRHGVNVCLGTDGAMWNNSSDLFREMKGMALLHAATSGIRAITARDVLNMATVNGYRAFGISDAGTLEAGQRANIILLDAANAHMAPLRLGKYENIASAVVYCATGRDVTDVFVSGRHVVERGQLTTLDVSKLISRVTEASNKIAEGLE
ncbi:Atrazine chlorohydrolase [bioreactor metagenome]|uniref:Atrazine chlorohydrolase n=1 Tax=bioreactor metagenome TaxID=1076179 RepID=A0A644ZK23_9ZZZZ